MQDLPHPKGTSWCPGHSAGEAAAKSLLRSLCSRQKGAGVWMGSAGGRQRRAGLEPLRTELGLCRGRTAVRDCQHASSLPPPCLCSLSQDSWAGTAGVAPLVPEGCRTPGPLRRGAAPSPRAAPCPEPGRRDGGSCCRSAPCPGLQPRRRGPAQPRPAAPPQRSREPRRSPALCTVLAAQSLAPPSAPCPPPGLSNMPRPPLSPALS